MRKPINDPTLEEADEDILTYTVSDEAMEAAADTEKSSSDYCVCSG
jgi:hypothetical protein